MTDWRKKSQILADVVFFNYSSIEICSKAQEVFVWDLDKTYLDTSWGSIKELWKTIVEKARQKKNVPGTSTLVNALKMDWQEQRGRKNFPIFFITASPPQMEEKIKEKLQFDDILPLGCFYKDNLRNLKPSRLWRLTHQIGFKLQALLQLRCMLNDHVVQVLWGDDSETDAVIYSLYSDICSRRLEGERLVQMLRSMRVVGQQSNTILELQESIPKSDPVQKIYINLATDTDPEYYLKFGRRLVPTYNTFQTAIDMAQDHRLGDGSVLKIAGDLISNYGFTTDELELSFDDLIRRKIIGETCAHRFIGLLKSHNLLREDYTPSVTPSLELDIVDNKVVQLEGQSDPWIPDSIDYLHDYR